tara:strand:+ start:206 stop:445 length:240 start_codon:yes stop_codon:yes gene_type:complete
MSFDTQSQVEFTTPKNAELQAVSMATQIAKAHYKEEAYQTMLTSLRLLQVHFEKHPTTESIAALAVVTSTITVAEYALK